MDGFFFSEGMKWPSKSQKERTLPDQRFIQADVGRIAISAERELRSARNALVANNFAKFALNGSRTISKGPDMNNPLADELIAKCMAITAIGKELKNSGSNTENDARRIERLYFEIGSLVLANLGIITGSLYSHAAFRNALAFEIPTIGDIKMQIRDLNDTDKTSN